MNINKFIYALLLIIYILDSSKCIKDDPIEYELLEYKKMKSYILNKTDEKNEFIIYLKMEVDKIESSDCLINLHQTNPQLISLEYTFDKNSAFTKLNNWMTINNYEEHVLYYEIKKEENKKYLYLKITVSNFLDKQKFYVESTDYQFNFFFIVYIVIAFSFLITLVIVFVVFCRLYKSQAILNDPNNVETIFAKVGPEDY